MSNQVVATITEDIGLSSAQERALKAVLHFRPQLGAFLEKKGAKSLAEYGSIAVCKSTTLSKTFQEIVRRKVTDYFGHDAAASLDRTFQETSSVDTSAHGGIFSEDTLLQSHAVLAKGYKDLGAQSFVSLACGVVPMNNITWPRGFFILGERESLFPKSFDRIAFHECPAFTEEHLTKKLRERGSESPRTKQFLEAIQEVPKVFEKASFYEQTTLINHHLWSKTIGDQKHAPQLFQLLLEEVTAALVIDAIEKDDPLSKLVFCSERAEFFFELLSKLPGTWSADRSKGTYLFWHASGDFRSAALWRDGNNLGNKNYSIEFTPENVLSALRKKEIVPSVFLSLISLLHNGARPLGGYHQLWYLPEYRRRLMEFSELNADLACPDFVSHIQCISLFNLGYGFAYYPDPDKPSTFAGTDTFLAHPERTPEFWTTLESTKVASALLKNLKRLYLEIVPTVKRDKGLIDEI